MKPADDIVRGLTAEDYNRCYEAWRDHMASFDWCLDTGWYGSVGEPGISDLDCIALVRDGHHKTALETHRTWLSAQASERQYLFPHEPLFITSAASPMVPLLHTLYGLRWDRGVGPTLCDVTAESSLFQNLVSALVVAPECAQIVERDAHPLRWMLLRLKSLHTSECYWANAIGGAAPSAEPLAQSHRLRQAVLTRAISGAQLGDALTREIRSSIARLAVHLDAYGERLAAPSGAPVELGNGGSAFRLTRMFGRVSAAPRTVFGSSEDTNTLHHNVFALAFGLMPRETPLAEASAAFWEATARLKAIHENERLPHFYCFARPFQYLPGDDDADLEDQEFSCLVMPAAVPYTECAGGRVSTGVAGHLVHGPYVRIRKGARYRAELSYLTESRPASRAGALDVSVCRLDPQGDPIQYETLGFADLPPTGGAPATARIEFDATQHSGALLETRVFAEAGTELTAFRIRICRIGSPDSLRAQGFASGRRAVPGFLSQICQKGSPGRPYLTRMYSLRRQLSFPPSILAPRSSPAPRSLKMVSRIVLVPLARVIRAIMSVPILAIIGSGGG